MLCFADDLLLFCDADQISVIVIRQVLEQFANLSGLQANPHKSQLSFTGRLQLIKSMLTAMQQYWTSIFILPKGVVKTIETQLRRSLWKGHNDVGYAKVSWAQVYLPVGEGGLGVHDIAALNHVLMCKHLDKLVQVIASCCGMTHGSLIARSYTRRFMLQKRNPIQVADFVLEEMR
ncbi:hypothetical protein Sango_0353700 [Sesamum angolense]|uniref:Reverse transcriptase domain-containing protein n=1 Tax=Sesamum angolense TaxID=2727404 RepID=A0AAE1XA72_9LAMI|nr:hypothetical protein Sango_0353700 [Sesamum angolense]